MLGQLNWQDRGLITETKFSPKLKASRLDLAPDVKVTHGPEHHRIALKTSLESLKTDKIDMWHLHAPERSTPFEATLREINNIYNEDYFKRFGSATTTLERGLLDFKIHAEHVTEDMGIEEGSRLDPKRKQAQNYRLQYFNKEYFDALDILRSVAKKHGLSKAECALRWISHHSLLDRSHDNTIIIGASSSVQLEENLANLKKVPVTEDVVEALKEGWKAYIFPQIVGLVLSSNGMKYGIATIAEAQAYLKHTELGERLVEITQVALDSSTKNTRTLMGSEIDVAKMHTCMTLFLRADPDKKVFDFQALLDKYYNGAPYAELDMMLGL
ncbi:hypothetical protein IFR05_015383 [Cadophora sp. M221]|nr:hypothetical protein IFR05_015383 [Cadophora sp. M221]